MELVPVIGLETHVQLKTASKLFCSCKNGEDGAAPNTNVCPVCVGHPGTLPVLNEQAVRFAITLGLALNGTIAPHSKFDRKHYFYPDLPKAYQISQFDLPIMSEGSVTIGNETIGLERMHLEEDAAKNIHQADGTTLIDFNRSSVPLCEIVTKPDFTSAAQAKAYLQELRLLVRTLGVSDGDMERGHLRCDVNVSLRERNADGSLGPLMPKTEVKNINSFRAVERAIAFEIERQTQLWNAGTPPTVTTTRGWNDDKQATEELREKESSADYRYFPEPDIPPLALTEIANDARRHMSELPAQKRERFSAQYRFKPEDAARLVSDIAMANFTEEALSELKEWLSSAHVDQEKGYKTFSSWLITKLPGLLEERKQDFSTMILDAENFAEFITFLAQGKITTAKGTEVLGRMLDAGEDPTAAMEYVGATPIADSGALDTAIAKVLSDNPKEVERYRAGETKLLAFFLGKLMKETKGNADPQTSTEALLNALK